MLEKLQELKFKNHQRANSCLAYGLDKKQNETILVLI
jgi:hypothetical protein